MKQFVLLLITFILISFWQTRKLPSGIAPASEGVNIFDGHLVNLSESGDKTIILYLFAPWCAVCKGSSQNAFAVAQSIPGVEARFVGLDYEHSEDVRLFAENQGLGTQVFFGSNDFKSNWGVGAYPTYAILKNGKVRFSSVGYSTYAGIWLRVIVTKWVL
ncbi:MAG: redoxin domain-containing protein [Proteobacteria bacterium]|nr:redoxin domain-containing protein [Pseudomonadota bacterium]